MVLGNIKVVSEKAIDLIRLSKNLYLNWIELILKISFLGQI
jgi:hypothetical protein